MTSPNASLPASPGISVILPVLNEQAHLEDSIRAILSQNYLGKFEVILALGPSRDFTNEIARSLAAEDARVILVENPSGRTAAGLNIALNASTQDVVVRVDAHAEIPNNYLLQYYWQKFSLQPMSLAIHQATNLLYFQYLALLIQR